MLICFTDRRTEWTLRIKIQANSKPISIFYIYCNIFHVECLKEKRSYIANDQLYNNTAYSMKNLLTSEQNLKESLIKFSVEPRVAEPEPLIHPSTTIYIQDCLPEETNLNIYCGAGMIFCDFVKVSILRNRK